MPLVWRSGSPNSALTVKQNWIAASVNVGLRPRLPIGDATQFMSRSSHTSSEPRTLSTALYSREFWGDNSEGQTTVPAGLSDVRAIGAGGMHSLAVKSDGTVVAWGWNYSGQTTVPAGLSGVRAIAGEYLHTVALKRNGTVVAWGNNRYGQTNVPEGLRDIMAIDAGGNHTVALRSRYTFGGFVGPVNAPPIVNTLRAGAGVPVKFSLGGNHGLTLFSTSYPASSRIGCNPGANTDEIEQTVNTDRSRLSYDARTDTYTYLWKTGPVWAGQCRRLVLRFGDGIEHTALFRLR
jgi:hypothetical protein